MTIAVRCSGCGNVLHAKESAAGKKSKCPDCGAVVKIPTPKLDDLEDADDDDEEEEAPAYRRPPRRKSSASKKRTCPMCGEEIDQKAVKCRFCNEILDPKLKRAEERRNRPSRSVVYESDQLTGVDILICIFCPCLAIVISIVRAIQGAPTAGQMFACTVIIHLVLFAIGFVAKMMEEGLAP